MNGKNKVKIFKIILAVIAILAIVVILIYLFPVMKNLSTEQGKIAFKERVNQTGIVGLLSLFGLQVAQIFLFIIPGEPIEILAGMCYGWICGTVFIMLSVLIISTAIFFLVKKLGKRFVYNFSDKRRINKIVNSKLFQNPKKVEMIMYILFLIPGTPKDLLTYIAGLLPVKPTRFIIISTLARFPSVISSTLAGANLAIGNWKMSIFLYGFILLIVAIIIFIFNKFDKDKTVDKIIETMK